MRLMLPAWMIDDLLATSTALWPLIEQTTRQALASGALQPIATQTQIVHDGDIPFLVRVVDSLVRKEKAEQKQRDRPSPKSDNPFLPYEADLFVTDLSPTHVCLLNKFNVVDHHLLVITREYESQQEWLTYDDFAAFARCLTEIDGLGFYNSGPVAGASQHHKHLQLIPLASTEAGSIPITRAIQSSPAAMSTPQLLPTLPFQHGIQPLGLTWTQQPCPELGAGLLDAYRQIMDALGLNLTAAQPDSPYNLLITRDWMMGIRRSRPSYQGINVNSLGYAGWLLVKTPEDLAKLCQIGPLKLLTQVGLPRSQPD